MKTGVVILSHSPSTALRINSAEAKNLMKRQTKGEILRRYAPQNDIHSNNVIDY
jgi:hypothetical protein